MIEGIYHSSGGIASPACAMRCGIEGASDAIHPVQYMLHVRTCAHMRMPVPGTGSGHETIDYVHTI